MPDGEIIYPQKADSLKAYPGKNRILLEWIMTDPRITSCDVFYEQSGIENFITMDLNLQNYVNDTIRLLIPDLLETTYRFKIISHDHLGHSSITVESEGSAYGELYENSLLNRTIKDKSLVPDGLKIEWYSADESELAVKLNYKDWDGNLKQILMPDSVNEIIIPDYDLTIPFSYQTIYKPVPEAIDSFYTQVVEDMYLFPSQLLNAQAPFAITDEGFWLFNRFGTARDWKTNEAGRVNGNVDNEKERSLTMWVWPGASVVEDGIYDAKIYQTLRLPAGAYSFVATIFSANISATLSKAYVVVAEGIELPNVAQVENASLAYQEVVEGLPNETVLKCEFDLNTETVITLGVVGNIGPVQELVYRKFELKKD
jgi:hypothetical protein